MSLNVENIIIEIGKISVPAIFTFFAGLAVGSINDRRTIKINSYKDQLLELYEPLFLLMDDNHFKYGAHDFFDLTDKEREEILKILSKKITYANADVYVTYIQLKWSLKSNSEETAEIYKHLELLIANQYFLLRKKLRLPKINIERS